MGLQYDNLDGHVRKAMIDEFERDLHTERIFFSPRLRSGSEDEWRLLLREAIEMHDDNWLAGQIRSRRLLKAREPKKNTRNGASVPRNAPETLAEGQFNRIYVRAVCMIAVEFGETHVEIYRGKRAKEPRPESQRKVGTHVEADLLLDDLRNTDGYETFLGVPNGPNSGLTVRRIVKKSAR